VNCQHFFSATPIVPVVTISDADRAVPLAEALLAAGVGAIEITLRTEAGLPAIESVASRCPDICVGAGSIRQKGQFTRILNAGARFCVSPGFSPGLLEEAEKTGAELIPGAATAAEVLQLYECGYEFVKFFPAELSGGINMLKAISAPLPEIRFFPTGGITASIAGDYLTQDMIVCVGGSWFVPPDRISAGDFTWIEEQAKAAMSVCHG